MKKIGIIVEHKSKLQDKKIFIDNYEAKINRYLAKGWKIVTSNMTADGYYMYIYTMLEIEENENTIK